MGAVYLISLPFVSAFNFSEIFVIPLIVCWVAAAWYLFTGQIKTLPTIKADKVLALFLASVLVSVGVNSSTLGSTGVNHTIAMLGGPIFFYLIAEQVTKNLSLQKFLHYLYMGYVISVGCGILEFVLVNFFKIDLSQIIYRPRVSEYTPAFLSLRLTRARSTFTESGYFAAYISVLFPLMTYYIWTYRPALLRKFSFLALSVAGMFVAFSISLFIFLPVAIGTALVLRSFSAGRLNRSTLIVLTIFLVGGLALLASPQLQEEMFLRKFAGNSYSERLEFFTTTLAIVNDADLVNLLFGFGPGSYVNFDINAAISVYINFLRDLGLVGVTLYVFFLAHIITDIIRQRDSLSKALLVSVLVQALFFISTPIYFQPHYYLVYVVHKKIVLERRRAARLAGHLASVPQSQVLQAND